VGSSDDNKGGHIRSRGGREGEPNEGADIPRWGKKNEDRRMKRLNNWVSITVRDTRNSPDAQKQNTGGRKGGGVGGDLSRGRGA